MTQTLITLEQLTKMIPTNQHIAEWHAALVKVLPEYNIDTPHRIAAFVAQCAHESGEFTTLKENLNYRATSLVRVWPRSFPNITIANQYANKPEAIANRTYANRMGNGSEASGDGWKYSGKGLIQLTGKTNYQAFADSIDTDLSEISDYLLTFEGAVQSAAFFWETNNLNALADVGDILTMTKRINGGTLGLDDRLAQYNSAIQILTAV